MKLHNLFCNFCNLHCLQKMATATDQEKTMELCGFLQTFNPNCRGQSIYAVLKIKKIMYVTHLCAISSEFLWL